MEGQTWTRMLLAVSLVGGLVGCAIGNPNAPGEEPVREIALRSPLFKFRAVNFGRVVGTMAANANVLEWAGVTSVEGTEIQVVDPDGTVLADPVKVDANGNFVIENLKESRPRIFLEATLNGKVRYSATIAAPRKREDVTVTLDAASTYLADKLRLAAMDKEVPLDRISSNRVTQTEEIVNIYLKDDERERVHKELDSRLNAYAFDHFMDDNLPVKTAMFQLAPSLTRGWKPATPTPDPTPTPRPTPPPASPTPSPTEAPK